MKDQSPIECATTTHLKAIGESMIEGINGPGDILPVEETPKSDYINPEPETAYEKVMLPTICAEIDRAIGMLEHAVNVIKAVQSLRNEIIDQEATDIETIQYQEQLRQQRERKKEETNPFAILSDVGESRREPVLRIAEGQTMFVPRKRETFSDDEIKELETKYEMIRKEIKLIPEEVDEAKEVLLDLISLLRSSNKPQNKIDHAYYAAWHHRVANAITMLQSFVAEPFNSTLLKSSDGASVPGTGLGNIDKASKPLLEDIGYLLLFQDELKRRRYAYSW